MKFRFKRTNFGAALLAAFVCMLTNHLNYFLIVNHVHHLLTESIEHLFDIVNRIFYPVFG